MKQYFLTYNIDKSDPEQDKLHITAVYMTSENVRTIDRALTRLQHKLEDQHNIKLIRNDFNIQFNEMRVHKKGGKVATHTQTFNIIKKQ